MVCSFSRFCILHWWSFPRPHHRKVLRKKENTNISSSQIQSSKKDWKKPYRFLSVIQTCQNNVKVIFPRGQADNYGKQNGVRIPRQILISRGYSGPIRHHFGDNPASFPVVLGDFGCDVTCQSFRAEKRSAQASAHPLSQAQGGLFCVLTVLVCCWSSEWNARGANVCSL